MLGLKSSKDSRTCFILSTRPDTRPTSSGWVSRVGNAPFHTFIFDHYGRTDRRTDGPTDRRTDGPTGRQTDGPTDGPTKRIVESRNTRLKTTGTEPLDDCFFFLELKEKKKETEKEQG